MRKEFVASLLPVVKSDVNAVFLTGDLGYAALEQMREVLGQRFINAGVAEQNMVGMAAGLALEGARPWIYSIVPFVTLRCLEQIRNDVCFHNLPIKIVGNGGGYTYGIMGSTHHALEDIGCMRALPNMSLFFPCEGNQVPQAVQLAQAMETPCYLRLSISPLAKAVPALSENPKTLTRCYSRGSEVTIVGVGHGVSAALYAAVEDPKLFERASIFSLSRFPLDLKEDQDLRDSIAAHRRLIVIEEHYQSTGIGEALVSSMVGCIDAFEHLAVRYDGKQKYGSAAFHQVQAGVSWRDVIAALKKILEQKQIHSANIPSSERFN